MASTGRQRGNAPVNLPVPPIFACINVYDDVEWLVGCLHSLRGKVEGIIVVDGAYVGFPHDKPYSTDGTVEVAKEFADVVVETERAWPNEIIKRNHYLGYVPDGKWWLRIDADEEFAGEFSEPLTEDCYMLALQRTDGSADPYPIHALFRKYADSRYHGTHHAVWHGGECLVKKDAPAYPGVTIRHHCQARDAGRVQRKGEYYRRTLAPSERVFRKANGL